ncbi:MAG: hypothetical protein WDA74_06460 [Spirochaetota bacterium]
MSRGKKRVNFKNIIDQENRNKKNKFFKFFAYCIAIIISKVFNEQSLKAILKMKIDIFKHLKNFLRILITLFIVFSIFITYASEPEQFSQSKERIIAEKKGDGVFNPGLNKYFPENYQTKNESFNFIELIKSPLFYNNPPLFIRVLFGFSPWSRSTFT